MKIAFDIDDTLIIPSVVTGLPTDVPNYETIAIYRWFQAQGHTMILWSGGGVDYAQRWGEKLGLKPHEVRVKAQRDGEPWPDVDIAFDDCDVNLAKLNVKVKRINNKVDRREWNDHKAFEAQSVICKGSCGEKVPADIGNVGGGLYKEGGRSVIHHPGAKCHYLGAVTCPLCI